MDGITENSTVGEKTRCTNCKCWRVPESFIGKNGNVLKRCQKCRDKDDKQKQKANVKEARNARQREKKYYQEYRQRKRAENEEEYLKHNAEVMKKWRDTHKDHLRSWKMQNVNYRLTAIKQQANKKGITWDETTMTQEVCASMMTSNCHYCGESPGESVHGFDRMNSQGSYTASNVVPCCSTCNFIKKSLDAVTFLKRCSHIASIHSGTGQLYPDSWRNATSVSYKSYENRATKMNLAFELSREEFDEITKLPCHYCQKESTRYHSNGVDRDDNTLGYTHDNAVPCCAECNQMKTSLCGNDFINACVNVAHHMTVERFTSLHPNMVLPTQLRCIFSRKIAADETTE